MTAASACGIRATDLATMMIANTTSTTKKMRPATAPSKTGSLPLLVRSSLDDLRHHRGGPVDMDDAHMVPRFINVGLVKGPCRPHLAVELDLAFMAPHPVDDERALALQFLHRFQQALARSQSPSQRRTNPHEQQNGHDQEHESVGPNRQVEQPAGSGSGQRAAAEHQQEKVAGEH